MDLKLTGKVIVVTGGAKGIGEAIVRGCAAEGGIPVIVDRDGEAAARLQAALQDGGAASDAIVVDISAPEACARVVEQTLGRFGRIDALVNNAGINDKVGLEHGDPTEFVASLSRNLIHFYAFAHYALPALKKSRGSIV
ncbi:MAG: SDR family NAD(P)-dependent oxidoreductase, partial [Candidatus Acidiferrales bacterium]